MLLKNHEIRYIKNNTAKSHISGYERSVAVKRSVKHLSGDTYLEIHIKSVPEMKRTLFSPQSYRDNMNGTEDRVYYFK